MPVVEGGTPVEENEGMEKAFALITRATVDGGGEERAGLYSFQAGTLNTFFWRPIARNGG